MLKKFTCKPGAYVEVVPLGLLCTLQYNTNGILQKIIVGFNHLDHNDEDVLSSDLTITLKQANVVPQRINFSKGTTWVKGVFYTKRLFKNDGILPECVRESMLYDLEHNFKDYVFYAGDIRNDSFPIKGSALVYNRLTSLGFTVLPGYYVYDDIKTIPLEKIMKTKKSPFTYPLVSGLFICESAADFRFVPANIEQRTVVSTSNYIDPVGYIHTSVMFEDKTIDRSYTEIVQYDVQAKSIVILDEGVIVHSRHANSLLRTRLSRRTHCSICGKSLVVPVTGFATCHDPHCVSKLYTPVKRFISIFNLPDMSAEEFFNHVQKKDITCLLDLLILDKYKDITIECTLSQLLSSIVPVSSVRTQDFFQQFTNYLGSVEAFDYYIQNPDAIITDLNLNKLAAKGFADWLKDPENILELETLLHSSQICIQPVGRRFEGSPIFRGKTICVTGKFKHGTLEDVISILKSYSATVTTKFDNTVNCVVIGHFEDEDKDITEKAVSYNIPIYAEDEFFKAYEIDLDIQKQRDMLDHYLK